MGFLPRPKSQDLATPQAVPALKDGVGSALVDIYAHYLPKADNSFNPRAFSKRATEGLFQLELTPRLAHVARALHHAFGEDYERGIKALLRMLALEEKDGMARSKGLSFVHWPMAMYIEHYGTHNESLSLQAMERVTCFFSCEFAVRPFLSANPHGVLEKLLGWARDENLHVRRNASEGIRPRLPWGRVLTLFVEQPELCFPILETLRTDPEEYVRRSVSNCLNDIAKDHPALLMDLLTAWDRAPNAHSHWIKSRALRTLVKAGDARALALLGFVKAPVRVLKLRVDRKRYKVGDTCVFQFEVQNDSAQPVDLAIDYRIHYRKANGESRPKTFKLRTLKLAGHTRVQISKKQHLRAISTRRYHPGQHAVDIAVNGQLSAPVSFELLL